MQPVTIAISSLANEQSWFSVDRICITFIHLLSLSCFLQGPCPRTYRRNRWKTLACIASINPDPIALYDVTLHDFVRSILIAIHSMAFLIKRFRRSPICCARLAIDEMILFFRDLIDRSCNFDCHVDSLRQRQDKIMWVKIMKSPLRERDGTRAVALRLKHCALRRNIESHSIEYLS